MTTRHFTRKQILFSFLSTLLVISSISLCYKQGLLQRFDFFLYDLHFIWRGQQSSSGKIVLVLMDDRSAVELDRQKNSWSRKQTTMALKNLTGAGAEIIGLDLVFASPSPEPGIDQALAQTINHCNNIVLAKISSAQNVIAGTPLPAFQEGMIGDGFIDLPLDQDGVLRRIRYLDAVPHAEGLQLSPSFSLELARAFLDLDFQLDFSTDGHFILGDPEGAHLSLPYPEMFINYLGAHTSFSTLSYVDVVNNNFAPQLVNGKIILIGTTLSMNKDRYVTPFSRVNPLAQQFKNKFAVIASNTQAPMEYGVVCQAQALETILNNSFITRLPEQAILLLGLLLGITGLIFYLPGIAIGMETALLSFLLAVVVGTSHFIFQSRLFWIDTAPLLLIIFCQFIGGMVMVKNFARQKAALITTLFGKYVSSEVVRDLISGDINTTLEGQRKDLSILFSDIRGFTTLSEELGSLGTSRLLNHYFDALIPLVFQHQGTVDKLMGDAIMAFFGAPLKLDDHPVKAAEAALAMLDVLERLKENNDVEGINRINIGIGLNSGKVTAGNLGSQKFMDYTIIGDPVNLASRLEGLNKTYGTRIIISEFTAARLNDSYLLRELDLVRVKGKKKSIAIFELMGRKEQTSDILKMISERFNCGLKHFRARNWNQAETDFQKVQDLSPSDGPANLYLARISMFRKKSPPADWDGIISFDHK